MPGMFKKRGLARKTFLFSSLLVLTVLLITFSVLYFALPKYYFYQKNRTLQDQTDRLVQNLAAVSTEGECAALISEFTVQNNTSILSFDSKNSLLFQLTSPFVNLPGEHSDMAIYLEDSTGTAVATERADDTQDIKIIIERQYSTDTATATDSAHAAESRTAVTADEPETDAAPADSDTSIHQVQIQASTGSDEEQIFFTASTGAQGGVEVSTERPVGNGVIDHIQVSATLQPIDEATSVIVSLIPWLLLLSLGAGLLLAYFFTKQLTGPILQISDAAVRMRDMLPGAASGVRTGDELGRLSENLDALYEDLRKNIRTLEAEKEHAGSLERSKTEFMQSAGHELKTPIAALSGIVEGMIDGVGVYKDKETYLLECKRQIDTLARLVGKILHASKSDLAVEEVEIAEIALSSLLEEAREHCAMQIAEKSLTVSIDGAERQVWSDRALLYSAFDNLMSNAVRYSPPGSTISISVREDAGGVHMVWQNPCEPIPKKELARLFEPFYTRSYSRDKAKSGTGLGLYLVKKHLARLDIPITVSMQGNAIRFHLVLPAQKGGSTG